MLEPGERPPVGTDSGNWAHESRIGVLLINLGTPEGTSFREVRRYLREFLWDRRVIEVSRPLWWFILHAIVLNRRPQRSGEAYARIWNRELDESPLKTITRNQCHSVAAAFQDEPGVMVDWAMRYGLPSLEQKIIKLHEEGCERILLFPLYPQYSATTTATAQDKVFDVLKTMRWQPAVRTVPAFPDHPLYIEALVESLRSHLRHWAWEPDMVLASFHGLPKSYTDRGDPYRQHCLQTFRCMAQRLEWDSSRLRIVFQSRFGRTEWIQPYAEETVRELAASGVRNLAVITPGFVSDCLETLDEVAIEMKETFLEHGGHNFTVVPCLNDGPWAVRMLVGLIRDELAGWLPPADDNGLDSLDRLTTPDELLVA